MSRVSIVIPIHNDSNYLRETIDSVLFQTYSNIEVIVINDGRNNGTAEVIANSYGKKIHYYKKLGFGIDSILNFGIEKMTGKYFMCLNPGDICDVRMISEQTKLASEKDNTIVLTDWVGANKDRGKSRKNLIDRRLEKYPVCTIALGGDVPIDASGVLIPAELLEKVRQFDTFSSTTTHQELLCWLAVTGANFKVVKQVLYRRKLCGKASLSTDTSRDFLLSEVVKTVSFRDIIGFFGDLGVGIQYFQNILSLGFPRTAAFLISKIVKESSGDIGNIILKDLSRLSEGQMDVGKLVAAVNTASKKKKIMFSSAHWLTGGMERVMSLLFQELKNDYDIYLITPYDDRQSCIKIPSFVKCVRISEDMFARHFDAMVLSYALILDIDVVVGFINLFDKQLNLYKLCVGTKIKTIASNHEYYFYPYRSKHHYDMIDKRIDAFMNCSAVVWPNNFNAALCGMYVDNSYVIGNPNSFEVEKNVRVSNKNKTILCVGRFNDPVKRVDRILESFSLVLAKVPDARLILVGKYDMHTPIIPGDNMSVDSLINKLALPKDRIEFAGEVNNVEDYYKKAKVLMLASNSEGFGMVINEAACFGVPSVCNYIPGIEDLIIDGHNGFIVEQGNLLSMSERVCDLLDDNDLSEKIASNTKKQAELYDSTHIGNRWRYLINQLVENQDDKNLRTRLNDKFGYIIHDQQQFQNVLANELNEVVRVCVANQRRLQDQPSFIRKLEASIKHEGIVRTGRIMLAKTYRLSRRVLKV